MNPFITIKELKEKLSKKEVSQEEVLKFFSGRIAKHNAALNAVLESFETQESAKGGPLAAIPCILKDNICQKNRITSCASKILSNYRSPYDATVTSRLKENGALIIGRGNMDEFAMGSSGEFSSYGPTKNPYSSSHSPGGSSSGPAASVAAGLVPFALGSETGGSVRQPAAFCNLVGLYPTYGLVSRYGLIAFASSTDQVGPITRTVYDNALVLNSLVGKDPRDGTSIPVQKQDYTALLTSKLPQNIKIGVIAESLESQGVHPQIKSAFQNAITHLEKLGAKISYLTLPNLKYGIADYFVISRAEAASNLYRFDGSLYGMRSKEAKDITEMYLQTRHDGFGDEVKRRILMGNYVLSAAQRETYYAKANQVRSMIRDEFVFALKEVDLLTSPTASTLPFELGGVVDDPLALYLGDYFTVPNCVAGLPGISISCGLSKNRLPIGFQFIGPRLSEHLLYQVANAFEQTTDFHKQTPVGF